MVVIKIVNEMGMTVRKTSVVEAWNYVQQHEDCWKIEIRAGKEKIRLVKRDKAWMWEHKSYRRITQIIKDQVRITK